MAWFPKGRAIRRARLARGWTIKDLASWTSLSPEAVQDWENGLVGELRETNLDELVFGFSGRREEYAR